MGPRRRVRAVQDGAGRRLRELSFGAVSYLAQRGPNSGMFTILTSTFARTNDAYRQEGEFRGYGIGYAHPIGARTPFRVPHGHRLRTSQCQLRAQTDH